MQPPTPLRNLADGCRFILLRTGERFELVRRELVKNCKVLVVRRLDQPKLTSLNHQCVVRPIVKPRIWIKKYLPPRAV